MWKNDNKDITVLLLKGWSGGMRKLKIGDGVGDCTENGKIASVWIRL
ncbi:MAG TPA: hypothetical protein VGO47_14230 [Chlamydiales bacterium]|nr:hypothetical protein [Chlamydiales bacterium]